MNDQHVDPTTTGTQVGDDTVPDLYLSGRRKRNRSKTIRLAAYAIGVALIVMAAVFADWGTVADNYLDWERAKRLFPDIVKVAVKNTVLYTTTSFVGGVVLGVVAALMRLSSIRVYRWIAAVYTEVFRGLPALLTIIFIGYLAPIAFKFQFPTVLGLPTGGIVALSLVAGAYLSETIRAGIEAVPKGQIEAARSLGMSHAATLRHVVVPQAFRIVIPPLTNELVLLLKDTSLLAVLGTTPLSKELTQFGRDEAFKGFNSTPIVAAGVMYLIITIPLTRLVANLEKRNKAAR